MFELEKIKKQLQPLDETACQAAVERQGQLLKPEGSLGLLEDISIRMAGITGKVKTVRTKKFSFCLGQITAYMKKESLRHRRSLLIC